MRITLFDQVISTRSPAGTCDLRVLEALRDEHDITVFASELRMPHGGADGRIRHVALRSVRRPALASYLLYLARACVSYACRRLRGERFELVQATDCSFPRADVCYAHFCHRAFLSEVWPQVRGHRTPRTIHSWLVHVAKALVERSLLPRARVVVVPSEGLARDIVRFYPSTARKIMIIQNTVDLERYECPQGFDPGPVRERMATDDADTAFVFVALGHFERKGLPILLQALKADGLSSARLWVVGGEPGLVAAYVEAAKRLGVEEKVQFTGPTEDVRPFLWSADAFISPSHYEAFSLGLLEAAAAGLPLLATRISGSEELLHDGVNGLELQPTAEAVRAGLLRFLELGSAARTGMGDAARASVEHLGPERFADSWRSLYASL
jgi:glycosyltransferase involved in cell wall biosynthesis